MFVKSVLGKPTASRGPSSPRQHENTVRYLQELYTIMVAVALQVAIARMFDERQESAPFRFGVLPLLVTFVATLIPFFHGTLRHLDDTYIEQLARPTRNGALLADFVLLFLQSCLFFALAVHIAHPETFGRIFVALLLLDALWAIGTRLVFFPVTGNVVKDLQIIFLGNEQHAPITWAKNNLIFVALLVVLLGVAETAQPVQWEWGLAIGIAVLGLARTIRDYNTSWTFYFPDHTPDGVDSL